MKKTKIFFFLRIHLIVNSTSIQGFPGGSVVKNLPASEETQVQSLGQEDPMEQETTTHSSILPWEIPWTEKPGWLQSMWWQRVTYKLATEHARTSL